MLDLVGVTYLENSGIVTNRVITRDFDPALMWMNYFTQATHNALNQLAKAYGKKIWMPYQAKVTWSEFDGLFNIDFVTARTGTHFSKTKTLVELVEDEARRRGFEEISFMELDISPNIMERYGWEIKNELESTYVKKL